MKKISYAEHNETNTKNTLNRLYFLWKKGPQQTNKHIFKNKTLKQIFWILHLSASLWIMTQQTTWNKKWKWHNWYNLWKVNQALKDIDSAKNAVPEMCK